MLFRSMRVDLGTLAVRITDPPVELTDARGRVSIDGDSLEADLPVVALPGSRLSLRGRLAWPSGPLLFNLDVAADSVTLADVRFIDPRFPDGAVLRGALAIRSHGVRMRGAAPDEVGDAFIRASESTAAMNASSGGSSGFVNHPSTCASKKSVCVFPSTNAFDWRIFLCTSIVV